MQSRFRRGNRRSSEGPNSSAEVQIEQGARETLTLDAEAAMLPKITTEVRSRRLEISAVPGRVETTRPIRVKLGARSLRAFESRGAGTVRVGPLSSDSLAAQSLNVRTAGAGDVSVDRGQVAAQKVAIAGS